MEKHVHAEWKDVDFEEGEITSVGYKNGVETNRRTVRTTGAVCELRAETEHISVDDNGFVWGIVKLSAHDADGNTVPTAGDRVRLVMGEGMTLVGSGNGNPIDHDSAKGATRALFGGLAQVILRRDVSSGGASATFSIDGVNSVTVEF